MASLTIKVNGKMQSIDTEESTPLLWVLRDQLDLTGAKYGCGVGQCGSCTVHLDGVPVRSCTVPVSAAKDKSVVTIEGLSDKGDHPLQKAWIQAQAPQCGYCQSGQIMQAAALLESNPKPSREEIITYMNGNLCRCGTYLRIVKAVQIAAGGEVIGLNERK
jgi:isoquinoline 1-oxidoreductase alpha subunit